MKPEMVSLFFCFRTGNFIQNMVSYVEKLLIGGMDLDLTWLQNLILGMLSGIAEILPVSAQAHRLLFLKMFGLKDESAVFRLMIHIATVLALHFSCRNHIVRIMRAQRLSKVPKKRRKRPLDLEGLSDFRLLLTTMIPLLPVFLLYSRTKTIVEKPILISLMLLINGLILYIPQYLPGCNKESGAMTRIDALLVGLGGAAGTVPGISCVGAAVSVAGVRGMEPKKALNLALLMNIPLNLGFAIFDLVDLLDKGGGNLSFGALLRAIFAGAAAFAGVILGVRLLRKITENLDYSIFGLYSWGMALLTFIFFLAAV